MKPENPYLNEILNALEGQDEEQLAAQLGDLTAEEGFSAGFSDRVMAQVNADMEEEAAVYTLVPRMFKWFAAAGVAAAIVLLGMVLLEGDSLSIDAMTGLSEVTIADEMTLELY